LWLLHERRWSLKCSIVSLGIVTTTFLFSCHRLPTKFPAVTNNTPKTSCREIFFLSLLKVSILSLQAQDQESRESERNPIAISSSCTHPILWYLSLSLSLRGFYSANPRETQLQFQALAHTQFSKNLSPSFSLSLSRFSSRESKI
jgi:hypothetical protein